jgi:hypothetical protein
MDPLMDLAIGLSLANTVILLGLVYLYSRIFLRTRAVYPIGLALFACFLLMHNLLTIFAYGTMAPVFGAEALPYLSAIGAFEFAGLVILLRMTV